MKKTQLLSKLRSSNYNSIADNLSYYNVYRQNAFGLWQCKQWFLLASLHCVVQETSLLKSICPSSLHIYLLNTSAENRCCHQANTSKSQFTPYRLVLKNPRSRRNSDCLIPLNLTISFLGPFWDTQHWGHSTGPVRIPSWIIPWKKIVTIHS